MATPTPAAPPAGRHLLVDPEGSLDRRNYWEKTSHSLLAGAILHVLYAEDDKTLAGVAAFLSDPRRPIEMTLAMMMRKPHLGDAGVHPARELLNKADAEHSSGLSTAMSFLGLYRDPVVARVTSRCDWRIADLVAGDTLPRRAALRPQPHQAADPSHAQPDRAVTDGRAAREEPAASDAADTR